jgi:hypothetical protein
VFVSRGASPRDLHPGFHVASGPAPFLPRPLEPYRSAQQRAVRGAAQPLPQNGPRRYGRRAWRAVSGHPGRGKRPARPQKGELGRV